MSAVLRRATAEDAERLAKVAEQTFRATFSASNTPGDMDLHCERSYGADIQRTEILNPEIVTLVMEADEELVAFSQLCWDKAPDCLGGFKIPGEIRRLYIVDEYHGRGIAQRVMSASLKEIELRGSDVAWLGVWERNSRAIAFYKKVGFFEVGEHEFHLGNDLQRDIIMCSSLNSGRTTPS